MTTEQKNYMLVARFYLEHKNDPAGLELWLKRRRQNPSESFSDSRPAMAFTHSFYWAGTKEREDFWAKIDREYTEWFLSLPKNQPEPEQPSPEEEDAEMAQVMKRVYESREKEKQLPIEFREWLASVEGKNPEHARFFRDRFSWEDWEAYKDVAHPGRRALSGMCNFLHILNAQTLYDFWPKLEQAYPYPIPAPRKIPFTPEEATEGRFLVTKEGFKREILFTNGKIWVYNIAGEASAAETWGEFSGYFTAITE